MADDFNIDDLLEAPFQDKKENGTAASTAAGERSGSDNDSKKKKKRRSLEIVVDQDLVQEIEKQEDVQCITNHRDFYPIVLLKGNLWTSLVSLHFNLSRNLKSMDDTPNRSYRYASYRQFCWWVHNRLGKGVRKVIPSCVVTRIRKEYPEANGDYTGFKDGEAVEEIEFSWEGN